MTAMASEEADSLAAFVLTRVDGEDDDDDDDDDEDGERRRKGKQLIENNYRACEYVLKDCRFVA
jgi:hypothetical protein